MLGIDRLTVQFKLGGNLRFDRKDLQFFGEYYNLEQTVVIERHYRHQLIYEDSRERTATDLPAVNKNCRLRVYVLH